jgi:putative FmdB family regulatory protein
MPIYEYKCRACGHQFETLVRTSSTPDCPSCQSVDLERVLSAPAAVTTEASKKAALGAARQKLAKKQQSEEIQRLKEERLHPHDH